MSTETIRIILLILSIISGFFFSFAGGYFFGKYQEGQLSLKWFERALKTEKQLADIMTEAENSDTEKQNKLKTRCESGSSDWLYEV